MGKNIAGKVVVVGMDGNGHFRVAYRHNRDEVIRILKLIDDGDHYDNILNDYDLKDPSNPWLMTMDEWQEFVNFFIERGRCELNTII